MSQPKPMLITLDPDVANRLRDESKTTEVPMTRLVNRALRKLFKMPKQDARPKEVARPSA